MKTAEQLLAELTGVKPPRPRRTPQTRRRDALKALERRRAEQEQERLASVLAGALPGRCRRCDARVFLVLPVWVDPDGTEHRCVA